MAPPVNNLLAALTRHPELDQKAVLAVARQEGLSGGIGDGGHAFGPFQLNNAGGVITGRFQGLSPDQINAWAWTPQGIEYALSGISKVAGGLHGGSAVQNIVSRFERPADPSGEIARALAGYGGNVGNYSAAPPAGGGGGGGGGAPMQAPQQQQGRRFDPRILAAVLSTHQALGLPPPGPGLTALLSR